jgi:Holliday junction DNA helicase RuvA
MVRGILIEKGPDSVVLEAGGLGYAVQLTQPALQSLPPLGAEVRLFTHHHVREDAQVLYGFLSALERQIFLLLMTVKGVGPKVALAILSNLSGEALATALLKRDLATLSRVPGVGKKMAERLGVELSDKVKSLGLELDPGALAASPTSSLDGNWAKASLALLALGYGQAQARSAVESAYQSLGGQAVSTEDIVKAALKAL